MASKVSTHVVDFSNVKEAGNFRKMRVPMGDYVALVVKVEDAPSKKDQIPQYLFTIKLKKYSQSAYPYYCKLQENQLWKLRNLLVAAGMSVPKKRIKLDPSKIVGKMIGVTMEDDEYEGRLQSEIAAVFPASELSADDIVEDAVDDPWAGEEDEDEDEDAPIAAADDEDEEDEEDEEADDEEEEEDEGDQFTDMTRDQLKRFIKKNDAGYSVKRTQSDDDLREVARGFAAGDDEDEEEEEEEAPAPVAKKKTKKKAAATIDDDDLEELDIEDL